MRNNRRYIGFDSNIKKNFSMNKDDKAGLVHKIILWFLFLACVAIGFFASGCRKNEKNAPGVVPNIEVAEPMIDSVVITRGYPAQLESSSEADVVARVNGQIIGKHYKEGDYVSKGELLFSVEPTMYEASLRSAQAQVESARSQLDYASRHLAALEKAYKNMAVSEMEVFQAKATKEQAIASLNSAESSLTEARTKLGYCKVLAPVSGKISESTLDVGAYVGGEGNPVRLATIYNDNDLNVAFTIPESEYASIISDGSGFSNAIYRNVKLLLSSSGNNDLRKCYLVNVIYESPSVEPSTGNLRLKAKVKNPDDNLKSGMYGQIMLPIGNDKNGILIKDESILTDQRGKYVYTLNDSNKVVYTPITIGELYNDTLRLVKSGLHKGDRYVTRAMMTIRNGETINPILVKTSDSQK